MAEVTDQPAPKDTGTATAGNNDLVEAEAASGGIKDTLESIIIALILAFVFRAFVVEAFVIPTGSMATTLLGAHMRFKCQDCGYDFTANYSAQPVYRQGQLAEDPVIPSAATGMTFRITCPNCGFQVPPNLPGDRANDAYEPPVFYGDRILVLKYAYLGRQPDRWDVVVFKSPWDQARSTPGRPANVPEFQQNYIKRLVGLPGEQLMLLDGDVYVRTGGGQWTVQPKPRHVQDALWRLVADNDYQPRGLARSPQPAYAPSWRQSGGSSADTPGGSSAGTPGAASAFTPDVTGRRYELSGTGALHFDPSANREKHALTDWLAFNVTQPQQDDQYSGGPRARDQSTNMRSEADNLVGDLQVRLTYERVSGDGPMRVVLTKLGHKFVAEFLPAAVRVVHTTPGGTEQTIGTAPLPPGGAPIDVKFENVDYRVNLRLDGRDVITSTPAQYAPELESLRAIDQALRDRASARQSVAGVVPMPEAYLETAGHSGRVSHLSLWRDIYYTNRPSSVRGGVQKAALPTLDPPTTLNDKEFFVLGDNSQLSLDARYWEYPIDLRRWEDLDVEPSRVPERFLLGKAFFVYWPAGYRPTEGSPGVIPNFAKMRLIH